MDRHLYVRALWAAKLARRITADFYLIGRALLRRSNKHAQCWPSMRCLAKDTGVCEQTVGRAIRRLRGLGLLDWLQRPAAWNRRDTNLYTLALPKQAQAVKKEEKVILESCAPRESVGSEPLLPSADLAKVLLRLGAAMSVDQTVLPDWLTAERAPHAGRPSIASRMS